MESVDRWPSSRVDTFCLGLRAFKVDDTTQLPRYDSKSTGIRLMRLTSPEGDDEVERNL